MTFCKIFQMLGTNPGKFSDLGIGEDFLARFHSDHQIQVPGSFEVTGVSRIQAPKGLPVNGRHKSPLRLIKDLPLCAKQPRLEGPN